MAAHYELFTREPDPRVIQEVAGILRQDGVIIYPTDTVYSMGCSVESVRGIERLCRIKSIRPEKARFAIICSSLAHLSDYAKQVDNATFRLLKRMLPGPYTFILEASGSLPRTMQGNRRTIGIRIPDHPVPTAIVEALGCPIITTSLHDSDAMMEYPTDPERILEEWDQRVDAVINAGPGGLQASTVVDCTSGQPVVVREGKGPVTW